jgi:hypothetical protein
MQEEQTGRSHSDHSADAGQRLHNACTCSRLRFSPLHQADRVR